MANSVLRPLFTRELDVAAKQRITSHTHTPGKRNTGFRINNRISALTKNK